MIPTNMPSLLESYLISRTKCLHIFFNVIITVLAIGVLFVMTWSSVRPFITLKIIFHYEFLNFVMLIVGAVLAIVFALLGILSILKYSLLGLVANLLTQLGFLLASLGYIIWAALTVNYTKSGPLYKQLNGEVKYYDDHKSFVDMMQKHLSCCGVDGFHDWIKLNRTLPASCCNRLICNANSDSLHSNGCFESLKLLMHYYAIIALFGFGFLVLVKIVTMTLSAMLYRIIKDAKQKQLPAPEVMVENPSTEESESKENSDQAKEDTEKPQTSEETKSNAEVAESAPTPLVHLSNVDTSASESGMLLEIQKIKLRSRSADSLSIF